ncbi:hypothetical protein GH714_040284 [Hevea brasiliensis]|uniref:Small ribosomal subunit protein uS15 N-terminal domain-containing protein n=1 Tax=Hevea brasiliensis TaxID=3981 RepID=A0A6A6MRW3_HEVBR|nr:hypothetical protein GH714_040284 [Hevea brasiliensis]
MKGSKHKQLAGWLAAKNSETMRNPSPQKEESKGISASALPYKRTPPSWLKISPQDVEENICKFAKKGLTPSQIGVILRDSHGIAQVKSVTGSKILRILKAHGLVDGLQMPVRMFKSQSLSDACSLVRLQEITVAALHNKTKPLAKTSFASLPVSSYSNPIFVGSKFTIPKDSWILPLPNVPKLPIASPRLPRNLTIIVDKGEDEDGMVEEESKKELQLSPSALRGTQGAQTMCISGNSGKLKLQILVDTCSTRNFFGSHVVSKTLMSY